MLFESAHITIAVRARCKGDSAPRGVTHVYIMLWVIDKLRARI
jgi:hypothetical protein